MLSSGICILISRDVIRNTVRLQFSQEFGKERKSEVLTLKFAGTFVRYGPNALVVNSADGFHGTYYLSPDLKLGTWNWN